MSETDILLDESIRDLEIALEQEQAGWVRAGTYGAEQFNRQSLRTINRLARLNYLKNPFVRRGCLAITYYVFGRGMNVSARDDTVNDVLQAFIDDETNQLELTGPIARKQKDIDLRVDGNLFFVLFTEPVTGHVRLGTIPPDEITDIIRNPQNKKRVWYYKRELTFDEFSVETGLSTPSTKTLWYRDFRYRGDRSTAINGQDIEPSPIYHVKTGGFSDWVFGVSEIYAALDWAKAYKTFLEDFATIIRSLARFAWRQKVQGGARGVQAAKARLNTSLSATAPLETNPSPLTGSTHIYNDGNELDPLRTAGSTTSATEGQPLLDAVAAAFGIPSPWFGNVDVGNHATAQSLNRPTELQFKDRQELWIEIYKTLIKYQIEQAVIAPQGELRGYGTSETNEYGESVVVFDDGVDTTINVDFPPILEHSVVEAVDAIIKAFTLDGKTLVVDDVRYVFGLLLNELGVDDVDEVLDNLFPEGFELKQGADLAAATEALREIAIKLTENLKPRSV